MSKVGLVKGDSRRKNVFGSLKLIEEEIKEKIGEKQILLKPNFVSPILQKASTHIDHMRGVLDFLSNFYKGKITIAEGSAGDTFTGYENFGFFKLKNEYPSPMEFIDLNKDDFQEVEISQGEVVRVSKTILDSSYFIISMAKPKTHDSVVATLSIKNIAMAGVVGRDKVKMHQGPKDTNDNMLYLAKKRMPDLASIDGFYGMEGEGPIYGNPVELRVAIASLDALAADRVGLEIMGISPEDVGYLIFCAKENLGEYDLNKIEIIGEKLENCKSKRKFHPHSSIERQLLWKKE